MVWSCRPCTAHGARGVAHGGQGIVIYTSAEGEVVEKYEGLWNTGRPLDARIRRRVSAC